MQYTMMRSAFFGRQKKFFQTKSIQYHCTNIGFILASATFRSSGSFLNRSLVTELS
jgi:hypothetical protein